MSRATTVRIDVGGGWSVCILSLEREVIGLAIKPPNRHGLVVDLGDDEAEQIEQALHRARLATDDRDTPVELAVPMDQLRQAIDASEAERQARHLAKMREGLRAAAEEHGEVITGDVLTEGLDFVAVHGHEGCLEETPHATWGEAHRAVLAARRNGATIAYVDERPIAMLDEGPGWTELDTIELHDDVPPIDVELGSDTDEA